MDVQRVLVLLLPVELICQIAANFSFEEYAATRATCRSLDATLLEPFGRKYAGKMQVMRTDFSLQGLLDLSKSRLSRYLKHVTISMEEFPPSKIWNIGPYGVLAQKQVDLIREKKDLRMLRESFTNLQVESVQVHSYYAFNPQEVWTTYGSRKVMKETTVDLSKARPPGNFDKTLSQMIPDLLNILGEAGAKPKRFEVTLADGGLKDEAFVIPTHMRSSVASVLSNLESLSLPVELGDRAPGIASLRAENSSEATYNFRRFLRLLEGGNLRRLRLMVPGTHRPEKEAFFEWLGSSPDTSPSRQLSNLSVGPSRTQTSPPPVLFENLEELYLDKMCISRHNLAMVIKKFKPTLRTVGLREPDLSEETTDVNFDERTAWFAFWGDLAASGCGDPMRLVSFQIVVEPPKYTQELDVLLHASNDSLTRWRKGSGLCSTIVDWHEYSTPQLQEEFDRCAQYIFEVQ